MLPLIFSSGGSLTSFSLIGIAIIFALSYNILLGQTGLLSFGHAVHYGLGGFLAVHVMNAVAIHNWPIPLPLHSAGRRHRRACLCYPGRLGDDQARRHRVCDDLARYRRTGGSSSLILRSVFGGESGITTDRTALPHMFGWSFGPQRQVYYLIAFWVMASAIAMYALTRTPLGRICNAVRDNPERVEFIGYDPHVVRYLAYGFAGFFAGIAGGLAAINFEIANSAYLGATQSGLVLFAAFIGGTAYFFGPILGAILVTYLQLGLTDVTTVWQLYFGLIFIGIVMFAPGGIAGLLMMHRPLIRAGSLGMVIPSYLVTALPDACACARRHPLHRNDRALTRRARAKATSSISSASRSMRRAPDDMAGLRLCSVVGGFAIARLTWRRIAEAWDRAATVARDRGYLA